MESVTPPLISAIQEIRWSILAGHSAKESVRLYIEGGGEMAAELRERWVLRANPSSAATARPFKSHYRRALWELIERGCSGQPVLEALSGLQEEAARAAQAELDHHLSVLPFKVLIPLLLFQFPAHLILLLGPLLRDLNRQFGG